MLADPHACMLETIEALRESGRLSRQSKTQNESFSSTVPIECTPRLGNSVRVTQDGSMMASQADRTAFHKTPQEWYKQVSIAHDKCMRTRSTVDDIGAERCRCFERHGLHTYLPHTKTTGTQIRLAAGPSLLQSPFEKEANHPARKFVTVTVFALGCAQTSTCAY